MNDTKRIIAEEILIRYGVLDYGRELKWLTERLGQLESEIEKKFETINKVSLRIDEDYPVRILDKKVLPDGADIPRRIFTMADKQDSNQVMFEKPDEIAEL